MEMLMDRMDFMIVIFFTTIAILLPVSICASCIWNYFSRRKKNTRALCNGKRARL